MNIDVKTIQILKNFANINPSIAINEGSVVRTVSATKTILAKAAVPDTFTSKFAIYNLPRFLGALSLFEKPSLSFTTSDVVISDGSGRTTNYSLCEESLIQKAPEKDLKIDNPDVTFTLTENTLKEIIKALSVLGLPDIAIVGDGQNVLIKALDSKQVTNDMFTIKIGATDKVFKAIFKAENITKILNGQYNVTISQRGIAHFKGVDIEYWIAIEADSSFE